MTVRPGATHPAQSVAPVPPQVFTFSASFVKSISTINDHPPNKNSRSKRAKQTKKDGFWRHTKIFHSGHVHRIPTEHCWVHHNSLDELTPNGMKLATQIFHLQQFFNTIPFNHSFHLGSCQVILLARHKFRLAVSFKVAENGILPHFGIPALIRSRHDWRYIESN